MHGVVFVFLNSRNISSSPKHSAEERALTKNDKFWGMTEISVHASFCSKSPTLLHASSKSLKTPVRIFPCEIKQQSAGKSYYLYIAFMFFGRKKKSPNFCTPLPADKLVWFAVEFCSSQATEVQIRRIWSRFVRQTRRFSCWMSSDDFEKRSTSR